MKTQLALIAFLLAAPALADTVRVPVGQQQTQVDVQRPANGMNKARVAEQFGEPVTKHTAVGEPPISSWEYTDYVVYFEGDTVLHSVLKHRRADANQ